MERVATFPIINLYRATQQYSPPALYYIFNAEPRKTFSICKLLEHILMIAVKTLGEIMRATHVKSNFCLHRTFENKKNQIVIMSNDNSA